MALLRRVPPGEYKLSAETLNALIDAANSWTNLVIEDVQVDLTSTNDPGAKSKLLPANGRSVLRIVHPTFTPSGGGASALVYTQSLSVAGVIPTGTEIDTALAAAYASATPLDHDIVILTVSSAPKLIFTIRVGAVATESGLFVRQFTVGSDTFTALGWTAGLY